MITLRERLEKVKPLEETTYELKKIIQGGIVTGSRAFKIYSDNSDIDVIIKPYIIEMRDVINDNNGIYLHKYNSDIHDEEDRDDIQHYFQEGFDSCYVLLKNKIYNLLLMRTEDYYSSWVYATNKMVEKCGNDSEFFKAINDKKIRIEYFEFLKEDYFRLKKGEK